jgi:hypothetical protein
MEACNKLAYGAAEPDLIERFLDLLERPVDGRFSNLPLHKVPGLLSVPATSSGALYNI